MHVFGKLVSMKRSLWIGLASLLIFNGILVESALIEADRSCEVDEATVCYDQNLSSYYIEPNASISVEVPTVEFGDALIQLWNTHHPDHLNALKVSLNDSNADLRYVSVRQAAYTYDQLRPIEQTETFNYRIDLATELNTSETRFIPMSGEGFAFLTNLTALTEANLALEDANRDGLIDSVDTFEKIQSVFKDKAMEKPTLIFSLAEPYAFYPFLTASGWRLFEENDAQFPGFEKTSFLESLRWIQSLNQMNWNANEDNKASSYAWDYAEALQEGNFVFNIVGSWMFVKEKETKLQANWSLSVFPKKDDESPNLSAFLTQVKGYVINVNSLYPSASHEVLRLVRSVEGLQAFVDTTSEIPLANTDRLAQLNFTDETKGEFAQAFMHSRSEPVIAFSQKNTLSAFNLYYELPLMPLLQRMWNGELSPEETQIQVAMASDAWLFSHLTQEKELTSLESK